jgi:hypothetical protein
VLPEADELNISALDRAVTGWKGILVAFVYRCMRWWMSRGEWSVEGRLFPEAPALDQEGLSPAVANGTTKRPKVKPAKYDCGLLCLVPPGCGYCWTGSHLAKKFKEELSLACRGRVICNQHLGVRVRLFVVRSGERSAPISGRNSCRGSQRYRGD